MMKSFFPQEIEIEKAVLMIVDCIRKKCRTSKPLIWHSLKVGCKLYELGQPKEVVIAGILHDLIEDTDCKIEQIKDKFGSKVAKLILVCTFDTTTKDYKKQWHKFIFNIKKTGKQTILIKVVDANENLPFILLIKDSNKLKEVIWKHQFVVKSFKSEIGQLPIFKEYQSNLKRVLAKVPKKLKNND